jgi:hypothetical protein
MTSCCYDPKEGFLMTNSQGVMHFVRATPVGGTCFASVLIVLVVVLRPRPIFGWYERNSRLAFSVHPSSLLENRLDPQPRTRTTGIAAKHVRWVAACDARCYLFALTHRRRKITGTPFRKY